MERGHQRPLAHSSSGQSASSSSSSVSVLSSSASTSFMINSNDSRSAPLLNLPSNGSPMSVDKMDPSYSYGATYARQASSSSSSPSSAAAAGHLAAAAAAAAHPRPEIILRWKRFTALVALSAVVISALTATLYVGIPLQTVSREDAESKVELFNSYSGVIMGFLESGISVLLGYLFPVFVVYLHNLKWSRHDDPAVRQVSKAKKIALVLFFPIVMVAIGNSLSAVQTNQSDAAASATKPTRALTVASGTTGQIAVDETLLRSAVRGSTDSMVRGDREVDPLQLARVAAGTRVVVGFPLHDWSAELVLPATHEIQDKDLLSPALAVDLLLHGAVVLEQMVPEITVNKTRLQQQTTSHDDIATRDNVLATAVDALRSVASFNTTAMTMRFEQRVVGPEIQLQLLTLQIPLTTPKPPVVFCSPASCVAASSDPLLRSLRTLVAASPYAPFCGSEDRTKCLGDQNAMFLYGSSLSSVGEEKGPVRYQLELTFAKLSWSFRHDAQCDGDAACASRLSLQLELPQSQRQLVLFSSRMPPLLLQQQALRLLQILQPPVVLSQPQSHDQSPRLASVALLQCNGNNNKGSSASAVVDRYARFLDQSRLVIMGDDDMPRTIQAVALLFLFQNADAGVASSASSATVSSSAIAWQRSRRQLQQVEYQIYVSNTSFGANSTWIACGILAFLSALVLVFPNARARLEPPKGGNARAERFIAVQTEEVYPNLIYKKRFRIGKTGEKIKFREFAVDSVTLHHRMEEDEQIEL